MKFATYRVQETITYGSVTEQDGALWLTDLGSAFGHDLRYWLETDALDHLQRLARQAPVAYAEADVAFLPPILTGQKIACIGVNYAERNDEYKDNSALPTYPSLFLRYIDSFVGHGQSLLRPPETDQLDYEGEIVLVIGKGGRRIPRERALDHIAGLTLMNEGTLRDWVRHAKFNVTQGKNFEKSGAIGPYLVTVDEVADYDNLHLQTHVNCELRQHDTTAHLLFPFDYLIAYLSTFMTLKPGDMISTGTPNGAGARFDPPRYLKPGDVVEVSATGLGVLRNGVADELPA